MISSKQIRGSLRVGRSKFIEGRTIMPSFPNFKMIYVLTKKSSPYGELGPYELKNEQGQIIENVWQFSKVYENVPQVSIPYSSGNKKIVWEWPKECHLDQQGILTNEYWNWRLTGKNNSEPVRNPVGWTHYKACLFSVEKDEPISSTNPRLSYIEARKRIYFPLYMQAVVKEPKYLSLKQMLNNGENLLITEVDGPHQESLEYYKEKYNIKDDFIVDESIEVNEANMAILLNDPKHPFGHGYCLAWTLLCDRS